MREQKEDELFNPVYTWSDRPGLINSPLNSEQLPSLPTSSQLDDGPPQMSSSLLAASPPTPPLSYVAPAFSSPQLLEAPFHVSASLSPVFASILPLWSSTLLLAPSLSCSTWKAAVRQKKGRWSHGCALWNKRHTSHLHALMWNIKAASCKTAKE